MVRSDPDTLTKIEAELGFEMAVKLHINTEMQCTFKIKNNFMITDLILDAMNDSISIWNEFDIKKDRYYYYTWNNVPS